MPKWTRRHAITGLAGGAAALLARNGGSALQAGGDMVNIPAGPFQMGTARSQAEALARRFGFHVTWLEGEYPERTVTVPAFAIDRYPVTNEEFHAFCKATGYAPRAHWHGPAPSQEILRHPVVMVSREDARAYARWAGKRLPTEEEWEKAARGTDGRVYPWGSRFGAERCRWNHDTGGAQPGTSPVDAHPTGGSFYEVMDMAGNVAEWTASSPGPGSAIVKGGCWMTQSPLNLRCAARGMSGFDNNQSLFTGFRCAKGL